MLTDPSSETYGFTCSEAVICPAQTFDARGLSILRLCKVLRRKLLPLLDGAVGPKMKVFYFPDPNRRPVREYRGDVWQYVPSGGLPLSIRSRIQTLEVSSSSRLIPCPILFGNLKCIIINVEFPIHVTRGPIDSVSHDDLLLIFGHFFGDSVGPAHKSALSRYGVVFPPWPRWLPRILKFWKRSTRLGSVRVLVKHHVVRCARPGGRPFGEVNLITCDTMAREVTMVQLKQQKVNTGDPHVRLIPDEWRHTTLPEPEWPRV